MRVKAQPLQVPDDEPFKYDKLKRNQQTQAICQLLDVADDPIVVSISSPWGSGKTTFLRMLSSVLRKKQFKTIYVNAWETDFTDNALVSLVGEMQAALDKTVGKRASSSTAALKKFKKVSLTLIQTAVPFAIRIATSGLINLPSDVKTPIADLMSKLAEDQMKSYKESKSLVAEFKDSLQEALHATTAEPAKPLVIMIDELDRCKPTYSIQVLEAAKHFFDIPSVAFLLAIDRRQLVESIKAVYGSGIDADEYLRKFIDIRFDLASPQSNEFCQSLFDRYDLSTYFEQRTKQPAMASDKGEFVSSSVWLFTAYGLSLRAQEQCFTRLSLVLKSTPYDQSIYPTLLMLLLVLREHDLELYDRITNGTVSAPQVMESIKAKMSPEEIEELDINIDYLEAFLAIGLSGRGDPTAPYSQIVEGSSVQAEKQRAQGIIQMMRQIQVGHRPNRIIEDLSQKIELFQPFVM